MRKHFPDIPRPDADTHTEPDADAYADPYTYADADTNADADAHALALAWAFERHDNSATEPGDADKPARGWLRLEYAQSLGMGAGP